MADADVVHENITGGCLCGKVRYNTKFPTADSWPPQVSLRLSDTTFLLDNDENFHLRSPIPVSVPNAGNRPGL